ncbi:hypothetical protein NDU88_007050 [Pleurodeles waltl]|uniref:Uncharacterized protein n=1 Tax=Pleurodeles waltl TaxID=8319 RepID=A0AAV7U023_PLEWA|nr:hypothetical protein NDU88_007050 [Pleurodeles waltl]
MDRSSAPEGAGDREKAFPCIDKTRYGILKLLLQLLHCGLHIGHRRVRLIHPFRQFTMICPQYVHIKGYFIYGPKQRHGQLMGLEKHPQ